MSKRFYPVVITDIYKDDAYYKDRKDFLNKVFLLDKTKYVSKQDNGYVSTDLISMDERRFFCFWKVKFKPFIKFAKLNIL